MTSEAIKPTFMFLATLIVATSIGPAAVNIFLPALPAIQEYFRASSATVQAVISVSMMATAFTTLAYGPLSDRHGRRPVLLAGMVFFLLGSAVCYFAQTIGMLIAGRVVQAAGGAAGIVLSRAIIADVYGREKLASAMAYLTVAMILAPMLAPLLGGIITDTLGWRMVFAVTLALGVAAFALTALHLPESHTSRGAREHGASLFVGFARLLRSPVFCRHAFLSSFSMAVFFTFSTSAPYVMIKVLDRPATEYGAYFMLASLGYLSGNLITGRSAGRIAPDRLIFAGLLASVAGASAITFFAAAGIWHPWTLLGPVVVTGLGGGLILPNAQAGAISVDPEAAGTASGLSGFMALAISAAAVQLVGILQNATPYPMAGVMLAAALLALLCNYIPEMVAWRRRRR